MRETTLSIGEVGRRAGLKASAIRYYEDRGILPEPQRVGGQRRYTPDTVDRLAIVDVAKQAGFTLGEVRELLTATDDGDPAGEQLRALAQRKLPEVDAVIRRAEAMRRWLTTATGCTCDTLDVCSLFDGDLDTEAAAVELTVLR